MWFKGEKVTSVEGDRQRASGSWWAKNNNNQKEKWNNTKPQTKYVSCKVAHSEHVPFLCEPTRWLWPVVYSGPHVVHLLYIILCMVSNCQHTAEDGHKTFQDLSHLPAIMNSKAFFCDFYLSGLLDWFLNTNNRLIDFRILNATYIKLY